MLDPERYKSLVYDVAMDSSFAMCSQYKWKAGELEFESLMRMLDNLVSRCAPLVGGDGDGEEAAPTLCFCAAGLQDRPRLQAADCAGEAAAQERRGNPRHGHGVHVRRGHGRRSHEAAAEVPAAAAAKGEDALAQLAQQLHQGQRGRRRGPLQQPDDHGERREKQITSPFAPDHFPFHCN